MRGVRILRACPEHLTHIGFDLPWPSLSDLLGVPIPALSDSSTGTGVGLAINLDARAALGDEKDEIDATGKSPWEDEDSRKFYEETIDLLEMVPVSLLGKPATRSSQWADATEDKGEAQTKAGSAEESTISQKHSTSWCADSPQTARLRQHPAYMGRELQ